MLTCDTITVRSARNGCSRLLVLHVSRQWQLDIHVAQLTLGRIQCTKVRALDPSGMNLDTGY